MRKIPQLVYGLLGFVLLGFIAWGLLAWRDRQLLERLRNEMGIARRDSVIAELGHEVMRTDTVYRERVREYPVFRDRLVAANPENVPLAELAGKCDQLILTCDQRIKASDVLADSLRAQVEALRELKAKKPPRFSAYAEGLYDYLNAEPVARVGADFRLIGPFSLTAGLEGGPNRNGESQTRGTVGARFTFR